ncbi:GNAT family N-acetyltransferase [Aliiroseovarius lamellibrachiae]|uniref:GNAT family N-acetyltransferase n=1 Tax=Aliiroseovarius lamellibrachiae TaxID=1924933 RepID=UPI001BE11DEF|nr:GNAT family N-acetyltransferase [Aliiroseovarius lamellibrachiae]MBT2130310.1 GNAT family N-acetyltransferase [Aliiroseovarius lamellibrachiae]
MCTADPIRPATASDLAAMNVMVLRAKAHWGYDADFMAAATDELTHSADELGDDLVVWANSLAVLGMAKVSVSGEMAQLDSLFIDPKGMGQGIGAALFRWAATRARDQGANVMRIDSDPFAEAFYLHMGAIRVGDVPSGSIPGRLLPLLDYALDQPTKAPQS